MIIVVVFQLPSHIRLCVPMDGSTPGLPVTHHLPKFSQVHVYCIGEAIQPSHPLPLPSPPAFSLPLHQGLFLISWEVLELQLQHQSFQ